jgi:hypothetical protein
VHYADTIPADRVRLGYKVFDAEGRQIKAIEAAKTDEQRLEAQRQATLAAEQERKDRVLLATFTSEEDLRYVRDERLATMDAALALAQEKLAKLQRQAADLEAQIAAHQSEQQATPQDLENRLEDLRTSIVEGEADIAAKQEQKRVAEQGFATDMSRYRELKGLPIQ